MFQSAKKKVGTPRTKADFKFEFHATRVPQRGWDKLQVSLIPLETGRITAKSGKALVRNGGCQWTDPVYESTKVSFDSKGKEGMYKVLVSTGSSRFGVLGDTTINLTEYVGASVPLSLPLPLQNCNTGTILHVKVQCLTPKVLSRDLEEEREASPELSLQPDEDNKCADVDTELSVDCNQGVNQQSSFVLSKERRTSLSCSFQYSSESLDIPSTPGGSETNDSCSSFPSGDLVSLSDSVSSFAGKGDSSIGISDIGRLTMTEGNLNPTGTYSKSPGPPSPTYPCKYFHNYKLEKVNPLDNEIPKLQSKENLSQPLDLENQVSRSDAVTYQNNSVANDYVTERTIEDLQRDAVSWKENTLKLCTEVDILKQQLGAETKRASEMEMGLSSLTAERDSLKLELLKCMRQDSQDRDSGEDKVHVDVHDAMIKIKMLEDELAYESSVNHNLNLHLQKNQESNLELLLKIQNLEDSLKKNNQETEEPNPETCHKDGKKDNIKMEDCELSWMQKFEASEVKVQEIGKRLVFLEASDMKGEATADDESQRKIAYTLRKELDELERDLQELTEENMGLMSQLKQANIKLDEKDQDIADLRSDIELLKERSITPCTEAELSSMVDDLKEKLRLTEEYSQNQLASTRTLLDDLNSSVTVLRSKNALLEEELKSSKEKFSSLMNEFNIMKTEVESHEKENALIASQKGQLRILRERAAKAELEHSNALKQVTCLEALNAAMKEEMGQVIIALKHELKASEEKASLIHERYENVLKVIAKLQAEKDKMAEQLSSLLVEKEEHEAALDELKRLNVETQEKLQLAEFDCVKVSHQVHEREADIRKMVEQFSSCESQFSDLKANLLQIEKVNEDLQKMAESKEEQLRISTSRMEDLQKDLAALKEDLESSNESRMTSLMKSKNLQEHNDDLQDKLKMAEEQLRIVKEHNDFVIEELRIANICIEKNASDLEGEKELLKTQKEDLRFENLRLEGMLNEIDAQYKKLLEKSDVSNRTSSEVEGQKREISDSALIDSQQHEIHELQDKLEAALKEAEHSRRANHSLQMSIEIMQKELTLKTISYSELDDKFQKLADDYSVSLVKMGMLEDQLATLKKESGKENKLDETFCSAGKDLENRTYKEGTNNNWENAYTMDQLQPEELKFVQQNSSCEYQKEMRTSELAREKEGKSLNTENTPEVVDDDSFSAKDAEKWQIDVEMRLAEALKELDRSQRQEISYQQKVEDLEKTCAVLEEDRDKLAEEINEMRCKSWDFENLQIELRSYMDALHVMKLEKVKTETTLEKISLDNAKLKEEIAALKEKAASNEDALGRFKQFRTTVEQKNELMRLRRQASELKQKLSEEMEGREELEKKISSLEEELQRKTCALSAAQKKLKEKEKEESIKTSNVSSPASVITRSISRSNSKVGPISNISSRDLKEIADLREKVKVLENELKSRSLEWEQSKQQSKEKQRALQNRIEHLELVKKQTVKEPSHSNIDQLQKELTRLHDENASLLRRENELIFRPGAQQTLQNELRMLEEENKELKNTVSKYNATSDGGNVFKKVATLENELAEALESNNMYKSQLQSAFAKQQHVHAAALENLGSVEQVIKDLAMLKRNNSILEEELREMRERYFRMSLQFAEVEAEREELVMAMKNLRTGRRLTSCKSY